MGAHRNITSLPTGITLSTGAEADDVEETRSVEISELFEQETGDIVKLSPINHEKRTYKVSGDGPADLSVIAKGTVATPSDLEETSVEISEAPNQRCKFTIQGESDHAFTDPAATPLAAGAEPDIDDLVIVSVEYSIAESASRRAEVENHVLIGSDGTPAARARETVKTTATVSGRGDRPAGVALGTGGLAFVGSDTGITIVNQVMDGQKRKDWNRWSAQAVNGPAAA